MRTRLPLAILIFFAGLAVRAEYRVFTLHITETASGNVRQVESTLDPEQYTGIYPLKTGEKIQYIETWRCRGRTDHFKAHCDNPRLQRDPAALNPGSTGEPDQNPVPVPSQSPELLN